MAQTRKFVSLSALAVLVCAPLLVGAAADPSSAAPKGDDTALAESVRVIDRSNEALELPDLGDVTEAVAARGVPIANAPEPLSAEEQPAVGERVEIVYSNAVVVHQQLLAGCTVSASAFEPYKSGLAVFSNATYHQTGCTTALTGTSSALQLLQWWGYSTVTEVQKGAPVNNNSYGYLNKYTCANTNGTTYRNTLWQISGSEDWIVAQSPEIRLACGK